MRVDFVRDQGEEYSRHPVLVQLDDRVFEFRPRQLVGLKIDSAKSVDLKIEPAGSD